MEGKAPSLAVPVSSSTLSSSVKNKVALKPGRSLMDWIKFANAAKDLTSTGGKLLEVSSRELAKHNTPEDAWIALRGKVYNITHYLEYHPGGEDELMRGAGQDATDLFNQVHRWVNAESMLQKCLVGVLKKSWAMDVPKFPQINPFKTKNKKQNSTPPQFHSDSSDKSDQSIEPDIKDVFVRFEDSEDSLKIQVTSVYIKQQGLIIDLLPSQLFVKIHSSQSYLLNIDLTESYQEHYKVYVEDDSKLEVLLTKNNLKQVSSKNVSLGSPRYSVKCTTFDPNIKFTYWSCKLINKTAINYNTYLFTFLFPPGKKMWVPIGCHVQIKCSIEGTDVVRSYTPICSSLNSKQNLDNKLDGCKIVFMLKIYPEGILTPIINRCSIGETIYISNYSGSFSMNFIENSDSIIMLAAGTGITPMIKIIFWAITDKHVKRSLQLVFFNKKEEDILWRQELDNCKETYHDRFQIHYILSEPNSQWKGYTGQINEDILRQLINGETTLINQHYLICGPIPFTQLALSCLKELGCNQDDVYTFSGS